MNAKNVFQLQLRHARQWQLSTGHAGSTLCADLSGVRCQAERSAHRI